MPPPCAVLYMRAAARPRHDRRRPVIRKLPCHCSSAAPAAVAGPARSCRQAGDRTGSENTDLLPEGQGCEVFSGRGHVTPWAASMPWFDMQLASSMGPPTVIPLNCLQDPRANAPAPSHISKYNMFSMPPPRAVHMAGVLLGQLTSSSVLQTMALLQFGNRCQSTATSSDCALPQ